jgi:pyruvate formate lyase activating enzyme
VQTSTRHEFAVGGLTPLTTIDLPGCLSAVVFCQGCPWRCGYCHNPELIPRRSRTTLDWTQVMAFLKRRRGLLDAVVFSGGEPTLQTGLPDAVRAVKGQGFQVALHTAGPYPERLARVLPDLDWVGLDIKAPFDRYDRITGVPGSGQRARESARLVLENGVAREFRTTVDPALLAPGELLDLARELSGLGVQHYVLQECRSPADPQKRVPIPDEVSAGVEPLFTDFAVRRA